MNVPILAAISIATALVVSNNFLTAKLIDVFNADSKGVKTALSFVGAAGLTAMLKFFGYQTIVALAALFQSAPALPAAPAIPDPFSTLGWVLVAVFTAALSGGVIDLGLFKSK